ncbi:MAG: hypothetical protein CMJ58_03860 [Planctomycetaceae bacterium]|nr:hypothetical protein [Planctomycetaceae bacterium]
MCCGPIFGRLGKPFVILQAAGLLFLGCWIIWHGDELTAFMLHLVGEEAALGEANVVRDASGGVLLTNPAAMARWAVLVYGAATLLIVAAATLLVLVARDSAHVGRDNPAAARSSE